MSGLEKILAQIADDSAEKCSQIMQSAKEEAGRIVIEARDKANEEAAKMIEDAQLRAENIISSAKTTAEAYTRTKYLEVRNAIVNDVIAAAYEEVETMSDEKYFELMKKLLDKYIEPGECVMKFSARDLERIPSTFEKEINELYFETSAIEVSKIPAKINSGFTLTYADFELNCSIKALFEEDMDRLKDILCNILFN